MSGRGPDATARFSELLARPDHDIPLDEAALLIAAHAHPTLDVRAMCGELDLLAETCPEPTFDAWRAHLFTELGFRGGPDDFNDPASSFVDEVLRRRRGLPITLAVVAMEVARRLGLPVVGVGMPGHFIVRHQGEPDVFVDPFAGGSLLDADGCISRYRTLFGEDAPFDASLLDAVGPRAILSRMLANLKNLYARQLAFSELEWVIRLRLAIPGHTSSERTDLAHVLSAGGRFAEAADQLLLLARELPDEAGELEAKAESLRARLN